MNTTSRISSNIFFNGLGKIYDMVTAIVWIALIARYLGRDGFGEYSLILAVLSMSIIIPEIGLNNVLIREVSRDKDRAPEMLKATIQVRLLLSIVCILVVVLIIFLSTKDPAVRASTLVGIIWILGRLAMSTNNAVFFAYERVQYDTFVTFAYCTLVLAFLIAAIRLDLGIVGVLGSFSLAAGLGGGLSSVIRRRKFLKAAEKVQKGLPRFIFKEALPVGGTRALRLAGNKIDTLILAWLRTSGEVAIYSGAYNLILRITSIPFLISRPLFPLISRLAGAPEEKKRFQMVTEKSIKLMLIIALPSCIGLAVIADKVVLLIFGPEFDSAVGVMRTLSLVLMFLFPSAPASFTVIAINRQTYLLRTLGLCIALNIALDFLLIPHMGYYGPCVATMTAELLFAFLLWNLLHEVFPSARLLQGFWKILLSAGLMGGVLYALNFLNLFLLIPIGVVIYVPSLFLLRVFTEKEIEFFKEILLRRRAA
jgi:O-antigen/teichoic acid export membrane protein